MKRAMIFLYGVISYSIFFSWFLYIIAFVGDFYVPKTINSGETVSVGVAALVNISLMLLFGLQHSIMARGNFKQWLTRYIPKSMERSTFVLTASLLFYFIIWQWQPIPVTVWHVTDTVAVHLLYGVFAAGWFTLLLSTFLINHFELFGLQQVFFQLLNKVAGKQRFVTPFFYKNVRHPMMIGIFLGLWATPLMTVGHLLFALGMTAYILVGIHYEERDLVKTFGDEYIVYQQSVPKIIPSLKAKTTERVPVDTL